MERFFCLLVILLAVVWIGMSRYGKEGFVLWGTNWFPFFSQDYPYYVPPYSYSYNKPYWRPVRTYPSGYGYRGTPYFPQIESTGQSGVMETPVSYPSPAPVTAPPVLAL